MVCQCLSLYGKLLDFDIYFSLQAFSIVHFNIEKGRALDETINAWEYMCQLDFYDFLSSTQGQCGWVAELELHKALLLTCWVVSFCFFEMAKSITSTLKSIHTSHNFVITFEAFHSTSEQQ